MEAARTLTDVTGVGLQIPAAKWNTVANDWFVGETFQFVKYDATAGHTNPIGPLTNDDGKTASLTPAQSDQPQVARQRAATTFVEGLGVGDDLEALARHEPVVVARVQLVVGVEPVEVHDRRDGARERVDAQAHEVDRAELGVGDEHDERGLQRVRRA